MADEGTKRRTSYRIGMADMVPIIGAAILFDIVSPFAPLITPIFAHPILFFLFITNGVNPIGPKNWIWFLSSFIVECIPGLSIFPMFVIPAARIIAISRIQDRLGMLVYAADTEKAKALAKRFLGQKKMQETMKAAEHYAVGAAAKQKDGSFNRQAIADKRKQLQTSRNALNDQLAPVDKNSGVKENPKSINYLTGQEHSPVLGRIPGFRQKDGAGRPDANTADAAPQAANENTPAQREAA